MGVTMTAAVVMSRRERERLVSEVKNIMHRVAPEDFNDEELVALVDVMRLAGDRETAARANVIPLKRNLTA